MKLIKEVLSIFYRILIAPLKDNFSYFLILSFLVCISDTVAWISYGDPVFGIYLGLHGLIMTYGVVLIGELIKNERWNKIYKVVFLILGYLNFIIDASVHKTCKIAFTEDVVAIVMGSNVSESKEFISTYFSWGLIALIAAGTLFIFLVYRFKKNIDILGQKLHWLLLIIMLGGTLTVFARKSENWYGIFLNKIIAFVTYEGPPDLSAYQQELDLCITAEVPDNVVLIIGESFTKSHSSLYGYDKETNPYLSEMVKDSLLFVYDNAISPATHTIECIKSIMSTYKQEYGDEVNWYECVTLPHIMKSLGYKTYWISNQSPAGMYDNIASRYAALCDSTVWVGSKVQGASKIGDDGEVLDVLCEIDFSKHGKSFVVIHLMGSHYKFDDRYPADYQKYNATDYDDWAAHKREVVANYDNSILYNDYVVSQIMDRFSEDESIVFYFSDHGIDLYESSDSYYGHAIQGNVASETVAKAIPYMIYCSEKYQTTFPDDVEKIYQERTDSVETESVINYLMTLLEIDCEQI